MLQLEPTRLFAWAFTVAEDGKPLGTLDISAWRERGNVTVAGQTFAILRKGFASSEFRLESGGTIVATATKPSVLRREFAIAFSGRTLRLRPRSAWGRALALHEGEREVGEARRGCGRAGPPPRCPTRCPCRSASSCCGWPCSSGSATTTPRPRRGSRPPPARRGPPLRRTSGPGAARRGDRVRVERVRSRGADRAAADRVIPDGCPELIVHRGDRFAASSTDGSCASRRRSSPAPCRGRGSCRRRRASRRSACASAGRVHRALRRLARRHRGPRGAARRAARAARRAGRGDPPRARPGVRAAGRRGVAAGVRRGALPGGACRHRRAPARCARSIGGAGGWASRRWRRRWACHGGGSSACSGARRR